MSYYRQGPYRGSGGLYLGVPALTPMVRSIMIASGTVWAVQFLAYLLLGSSSLSDLFGLVPVLVVRGHVWQPITYLWLHSPRDIWHILFNMLVLWFLGGDLELRWGRWAFLRYYLICGIGAAPFIVVAGLLQGAEPASVPTIGASGAIFGVILAFGMVFADRPILFMLMFPMRSRTFAVLMFLIAFVSTLSASPTGISHVAHLGGMVVGLVYLKRAWRVGELYREIRWRMRRRRLRVIPRDGDDRWVH
jgi:membrane associated rhomboid family serine protease